MERTELLHKDRLYAQSKIRRNILECYYRDNIELLIENEDPNWYLEACEKYKESVGKKYKYIFWTINPRDGTKLECFFKKISKAIKKKWVMDWGFCLEQRGKDFHEIGKGMHSHIFTEIDDSKNPYHCKREMFNTFKDIVGNKMHVIPRYSNNKSNFVNYIKGIKKDGEKDVMIQMDELWREEENLEAFYWKEDEDLIEENISENISAEDEAYSQDVSGQSDDDVTEF